MSWEIRSGAVVFTGFRGDTMEVGTMEDRDCDVGFTMEVDSCGRVFDVSVYLGRDDRRKLIEVLAAMDEVNE